MRIRIVGKKQINYFLVLAEQLNSKFSGDTHIHIYVYIYMYICIHTHVYTYIYIHIQMYNTDMLYDT